MICTKDFDETQCVVSAEELAWLGSVPRTLSFDVGDQDPDTVLPETIPLDFHGDIDMAAPQLLVDVSIKRSKHSSSSDDDDDDGGGGGGGNESSDDVDGSYCSWLFHNPPPSVSVKIMCTLKHSLEWYK